MKKSILAVVAASLAIPAAANAQDRDVSRDKFEERANNQFAEADSDGSGMMDRSEIKAMLEAQEAKRAERRGEEARPVRDRRIDRWLDGKDTDSDGLLSMEEFVAVRMSNFDEKDANGNGVLEASERN